jgi:membrane protein DedA with SNARE-associated domain
MKLMGLSTTILAKSTWLTVWLLAALSHFTYVALASVLIFAGLGLPLPEDIPLVLSGYLCSEKHSPIRYVMIDSDDDGVKDLEVDTGKRVPQIPFMILAGLVGVLIGDSIVFTVGRRGIEGRSFVARHLRKIMHTKRRERVERHFATHGDWTVFAGRFMPGFRSVVFAFAGLSRMSYLRFLLIDGLAACISVPVFILLGYHFAGELTTLWLGIDRVKHILLPILVAAAVAAVLVYWLRHRREQPLQLAVNATPLSPTPELVNLEPQNNSQTQPVPAVRVNAERSIVNGSSPLA